MGHAKGCQWVGSTWQEPAVVADPLEVSDLLEGDMIEELEEIHLLVVAVRYVAPRQVDPTYQVLGGFGSAIWTHGSGLGQDVRPIKLNGLDLGLGMTQPTKPRNPVKNGKAVCNASQ